MKIIDLDNIPQYFKNLQMDNYKVLSFAGNISKVCGLVEDIKTKTKKRFEMFLDEYDILNIELKNEN